MDKRITNIGVLTSGGDSPGMNAAIRAVARACAYYKVNCTGIYRGYQGMIEGDFITLGPRDVNHIVHSGGTMLKSARCLPFFDPESRRSASKKLRQQGIDALVTIGGDGTFSGALQFYKECNIPVLGIPGTIDNDIYGTDSTLGYDTALNTVVEAIDKIRDTASSHNRLFFVEVMGRDAGHIALNTGLGAGAEEILIPEENMGRERLVQSLKRSRESGKNSSIVVVAEGDTTGKSVFELKDYVEQNLPEYEVRVSVLGYIQRGGAPSCWDRVLASRFGIAAVEALLDGRAADMVGIIDNHIKFTPLAEAVKGKSEIKQDLIRVSDILTI